MTWALRQFGLAALTALSACGSRPAPTPTSQSHASAVKMTCVSDRPAKPCSEGDTLAVEAAKRYMAAQGTAVPTSVEFTVEHGPGGVVAVSAIEPNPPGVLVWGRYEREVRMHERDLSLIDIVGGQ